MPVGEPITLKQQGDRVKWVSDHAVIMAGIRPDGHEIVPLILGPNVIPVTFSLDTNAYASGDVLAATQEIANAVPYGSGYLDFIQMVDKDAQSQAIDLIFLSENVTVGAENSALAITDANADKVLGVISILAADWKVGLIAGNSTLTLLRERCRIPVENGGAAADAKTSIWVAAVCRSGTPTYAAGLTARFGFVQN